MVTTNHLFVILQDFQQALYGTSLASQKTELLSLSNYALCLPVSVKELVQPNQTTGVCQYLSILIIKKYITSGLKIS